MEQEAVQLCEQCQRPIPPVETAFLHDGRVLCRDCHDDAEPLCPYCQKQLPAKPKPLAACPFCRQVIEIRPRQLLYDSSLLTREQAQTLDEVLVRLKPLLRFGIHERDYVITRDEMTRSAGGPPAEFDLLKALFYQASKRTSDPEQLAALHMAEAEMFFAHGKNHYFVLRKSLQQTLHDFQRKGMTCVRLVGVPDDCRACRRFHNQQMPLQQAIAESPLPVRECPYKVSGQEMQIGGEKLQLSAARAAFCQGRYVPCR